MPDHIDAFSASMKSKRAKKEQAEAFRRVKQKQLPHEIPTHGPQLDRSRDKRAPEEFEARLANKKEQTAAELARVVMTRVATRQVPVSIDFSKVRLVQLDNRPGNAVRIVKETGELQPADLAERVLLSRIRRAFAYDVGRETQIEVALANGGRIIQRRDGARAVVVRSHNRKAPRENEK